MSSGNHYLVTGTPGVGKTTVGIELASRGFHVVHADEQLASGSGKWIWNAKTLDQLLKYKSGVFVCGGADNEDCFYHHFKRIFVLRANPAVVQARLKAMGRSHPVCAPKARAGGYAIDANKSVRAIVYDILHATGGA